MAKVISNIEIKYSRSGILLKDGKNMVVIHKDDISNVVEEIINLM